MCDDSIIQPDTAKITEDISDEESVMGAEGKNKKKRRGLLALIIVVSVLALVVGACALYLGDYYRADMQAIEAYSKGYESVSVSQLDFGLVFFGDEINAGFIFYPGGKVEYTAYTPLMEALASRGVMCILLEMPFNLAVLDMNAADNIKENYPDIEHWFIGGHSLGGAMASSYVANNTDEYDGLILLGSYSTSDLSHGKVRVLSLFGSEDKVMNRDKYNSYKKNLPTDFSEFTIDGGCHAYFGMYGEQSGDGEASISVQEQIELSAMIISAFTEKQ